MKFFMILSGITTGAILTLACVLMSMLTDCNFNAIFSVAWGIIVGTILILCEIYRRKTNDEN